MAASKKTHFPAPPILNIISWNFHGLILGLVELIDAKGIGMAQLVWLWGCPTYAQEQAKNAFLVFLGCFWAFVGQPHNYIGWARPMPFASINSTNPRTNPWNFHEKILRIGRVRKWGFFEAAILNFLSRPFWFFFCFISVKNPAHLYEVLSMERRWNVGGAARWRDVDRLSQRHFSEWRDLVRLSASIRLNILQDEHAIYRELPDQKETGLAEKVLPERVDWESVWSVYAEQLRYNLRSPHNSPQTRDGQTERLLNVQNDIWQYIIT